MNRRNHLAHVAHIRGASIGACLFFGRHRPSQALRVAGKQRGHDGVVDHVQIGVAHRRGFEPTAGGQRRRFETRHHFGNQLLEPLRGDGPNSPCRLGVGGDDVRSVTTVIDHAVIYVSRTQRLTQCGHIHVGVDEGIQSVDAIPGGESGVRVLAEILDRHVAVGLKRRIQLIIRAGVDHHRRGRIFEGAGVDQIDLAAAAFLCRGSQNGDADTEVLDNACEGYSGADGRGGDDVVAAGVTHLGQCVVLATDDDARSAGADCRLEGGFESVGGIRHLEALGCQELAQAARRLELLILQLGIVVHPMGRLAKLVLDGGECRLGGFFVTHANNVTTETYGCEIDLVKLRVDLSRSGPIRTGRASGRIGS